MQLLLRALNGEIDDDESAERHLRTVSVILWFFGGVTAAWALLEVRRSPAQAIEIFAGVPFYAALAWYLPRTKSRVLACYLLLQPSLALYQLYTAAGRAQFFELTKLSLVLLTLWNTIEIVLAISAIRVTFPHQRRKRAQVAWRNVVVSMLATAALGFLANMGVRELLPSMDPASADPVGRATIVLWVLLLGVTTLVLPSALVKRDVQPLVVSSAKRRPRFQVGYWAAAPVFGGAIAAAWFARVQPQPQPHPELPAPPPPVHQAQPARPAPTPTPAPKKIADEPPPIESVAVFGGRKLAWWSNELNALRGKADTDSQQRYALLSRRAEANGLTITDSVAAPEATFLPKITNRIAGRAAGELAETSSKALAAIDASLPAIVAELRRRASKDVLVARSDRRPRIVLAPRGGDRGALRIQFAAGAFHDGEYPGLTRLSQFAVLVSGAHEPYTKLAEDLDRIGGTLSVETGMTESAFSLSAPAREFDQLALRLIRICLSPEISDLTPARSRALGTAGAADTDALATLLAGMAFDRPGFTNARHVDAEGLSVIDSQAVQRHLAGPLSPANATITVAGAFDVVRLRAALSRIQGGRSIRFERGNDDLPGTYQAELGMMMHVVAYPVSLGTPDDVAAAHLIAAIVEEHLLERFRSLGAAYTVSAVAVHRPWLDFVLVAVPFGLNYPAQVGQAIEQEVSALAGEQLTIAALERNRAHVVDSMLRVDEDAEALARALATGDTFEWTGPGVAERVASLDRDRLAAIVRPWLQPARAIHLELSPPMEQPRPERRKGRR